jgi:chromosome segregation ATPase
MKAFVSGDPLQNAADIIHQLDQQQEQIKELREQENNHTIAIQVMASKIDKDKKRQSDAEAMFASLHKTIADKEKSLSESSKKLDMAVNDCKKLKAEKSQEAIKAMDLSARITSLQKVLKDRDASINEMAACESNFNDRLASEQQRTAELKQECESLRAVMEESQNRLERLESFRGSYQEINEKAM